MFFVGDDFVLCITGGNIDKLIARFQRVQALQSVQKILFSGCSFFGSKYNYILCRRISGCNYIDAVSTMSDRQNAELGIGISSFLDSLHAIAGSHYDIGHYIPVIPGHSGSWQEGHERYWEFIRNALSKLELNERYNTVFNDAFQYLDAHANALAYTNHSSKNTGALRASNRSYS
jgi:hypothetical protein